MTTKLDVEGFKFKAEKIENGFRIVISDCPWHNIMIKSGREKLAGVVGESICSSEYQAWSSEIDENVRFELKSLKCKKSPNCILEFIYK